MPKVLFLGCNDDQVPYLVAAQSLGFTAVGTGMNARAPGAALADRFHQVSYVDTGSLLEAVRSESWDSDDRVFTAAAHLAYEGAALVADALGIPFLQPSAVLTCLDKSRFYPFLRKHGIPVPETHPFDPLEPNVPDPGRTYFLKSDYGKSPRYCYRIADGQIPPLPGRYDDYYRRHLLLQEEVRGTHFRINLYADQVAVFLKCTETVAVPLRVIGPGHQEITTGLRRIVVALGVERFITKFDVVVDENSWYVLDIGLDPPFRLLHLCTHLGFDFPAAYSRHYLLGDSAALPRWETLCQPVIICGSAGLDIPVVKAGAAA